jgi:hypothetical protein
MTEKIIKGRLVQKHDVQAHWELAINFVPKQGEIIIYDIDENYNYERFKIGDGIHTINDLPFADETITKRLDNLALVATTGLIDDLEIGEDTVLIFDGGSVGTDIEINGSEESGQSLQINSNDDSQIKGMSDSEIINELANTNRGITANII